MDENKTIMQQFIEVMRDNPDHAYDFIANHYTQFYKDELASIVKELLYGFYEMERKGYIWDESGEFYKSVADELDEYYNEEE